MISRKDVMPVGFLKKERFTGSFKGMRYRMEKYIADPEAQEALKVSCWPEPYGYDATPEKLKEAACFSLDEEGIAQGVAWLNDRYREKQLFWEKARHGLPPALDE